MDVYALAIYRLGHARFSCGLIYFVGIIGLGNIVLIFRIWFQAVYCGPFGPNGIGSLLKMRGKL